ncbi:MAG: hypothetical protein GY847_31710 [Proteobacteria bacterium]|nr:hypothetical protein [Pseudomonadota bacterium]
MTIYSAIGLSVAVLVATVLASVLSSYALLASPARRMFANPPAIRRVNRAAGSVMVAAGVAIAVRS